MQVTGWTFWENPNYVDITTERVKLACEKLKDIPRITNRSEFLAMSEKEQDEFLEKRNQLTDEAMNCDEIKQMDDIIEQCRDAVIKCVRENGYHFTGSSHQCSDYGVPIIDNKYMYCVSQRNWGSIIADAFPEEIDNSDGYGYLDWAWVARGKEVLPNGGNK